MTRQVTKQVEGEVQVCRHRVTYRYWDFEAEVTDDLEKRLKEHAEERARDRINEECLSGELNCVYTEGDRDEEVRGWWEIKAD